MTDIETDTAWLFDPEAAPGEVSQLTPAELAEALSMSTRQLRRLEDRGLPVVGKGHGKRYPCPAALVWFHGWRRRIAEGEGQGPDHLDLEAAARLFDEDWSLAMAFEYVQDPEGCLEAWELEEFPVDAAPAVPRAMKLLKEGGSPWDFWPPGAPVPDDAEW